MSGPRQTTSATGAAVPGFDFAAAVTKLTAAAARAGAAMMRHYEAGPAVEFKADNSPVTCADRDSEAIALTAIAALAPTIPIVSEESAGDCTQPLPPRFFLVDPLDGTKEFINKRDDFTLNIALIDDGRPVFGLVYAPARERLGITVAPGQAVEARLIANDAGADFAALDTRPLRARPSPSGGLTALVSRSHLDPDTEAFLARLTIAERTSAGSSIKFLEIAAGGADVYPRLSPTMEWDTAAGQAVLEAAGGRVVDLEDKPLAYGKTARGLRNPSFVAWGGALVAARI